MELLLNNWPLILIILIGYLFRKMGNARKEAERNPRPRPGDYGKQTDLPRSLEKQDSMERETLHREPLSIDPRSEPTFSYAAPPMNETAFPMNGQNGTDRDSITSSRGTAALDRSKQNMPLQDFVSLNKVVQGMMWAEIYGKPRALNPHRSLRKGRRA
jgi:hypothetical protein